jgi:tetratricopeptide (TPR) repeat protein
MPLAVRITAARLRHHRALRVEDVAGQLRDENARLDHLRDEDRSLAAVFDLSYAALPAAEQHMFRHLGLIPGPDADAWAAASLTAISYRTAGCLLESLVDHNPLTGHAPGRYQLHDLTRIYARTLAGNDPAAGRAAAAGRLLDYCQHTAQAADRQLARHTRPGPAPATAAPAVAPQLPDRAEALAWMRTERDNLLAAAQATIRTSPARGIALTAALAAFLHQEGSWQQAATLHQAAATAARDLGDRHGEATACQDLGLVRYLTGDYPAAAALLEQALAIFQDLGDHRGEAEVLNSAAALTAQTAGPREALAQYRQALHLAHQAHSPVDEARALEGIARCTAHAGDRKAALAGLREAVALYRRTGAAAAGTTAATYLAAMEAEDRNSDAFGTLADVMIRQICSLC